MNFRTLALATLAIAPLATGAIAQEAGSSFVGTPERDIVNTASPREFSAPRVTYRSANRAEQVDATRAYDRTNVPEAFSSAGQ